MLRYYSVTSLVSIIIAAVLLTLVYRQATIHEIRSFGERGNVLVTQGILEAVRPELSAFLQDEELHHGGPFPSELAGVIERLTHYSSVQRIDVVDDEGIVLFSTDTHRIGEDRTRRPGYRSAIAGEVYSRFDYRKVFSFSFTAQGSDDVVMTHVPIGNGAAMPVLGVLAVETDVSPFVAELERGEMRVFLVSIAVMAVLYVVLLGIVRKAERLVSAQESAIRERSHALELLSAQLLTTQEEEKKRLARELNEGVAQTLGALKFRLEHAATLLEQKGSAEDLNLAELVPLIRGAMQDVRALAMDIRPPSLDEIGVLATLQWYCKELRSVYGGLELDCEASVLEQDVPKPLKIVLFRIVQELMVALVSDAGARRLQMRVGRDADQLWLRIDADRSLATTAGEGAEASRFELAALRERITLSGGTLEMANDGALGGAAVRAVWPA